MTHDSHTDPLTRSFLEDNYYVENKKKEWTRERYKTMQAIWMASLLIFLIDLRAMGFSGELVAANLLLIIRAPLLIFSIGLFAWKQPLITVIAASLAALGYEGYALYSGWVLSPLSLFFSASRCSFLSCERLPACP